MPVTVIIGGQFGSEGKGKVAHFWAKETNAKVAIRVGGPNSGHTAIDSSGKPIILRQLPTAALLPNVMCAIAAGSYIKPEILLKEIAFCEIKKERLLIDPNAVIITENEEQREQTGDLRQRIGSTQSGTGAAVQSRIGRSPYVKFAKDEESLQKFVKPVSSYLRKTLEDQQRIIIEGTQGFGLSLLHSNLYPYVTSRDTSASAFVSEVGLSPLDVDEVVMVLRSFPIRVSGHSGPLPNEIDWTTLTNESGSQNKIQEYTSVTKTVRRIARFDPEVVRHTITVNRPTHIILNHVDYIDASCANTNVLTPKTILFIEQVQRLIGQSIEYIGLGPSSLLRQYKFASKVNEA
jgi:adenylosuccinate synthase